MDHQLKTVQVYNEYVNEYLNKFMHFDLYNDTFDAFLNLLPQESSILELGCGPGNVVKYFLDKRPDLDIWGLDLAPEMLKQAELLNPRARFSLMDIRNVGQIAEVFDAVVGAFCLPYLSFDDLDLFFKNLGTLTKDQGVIYLSCMEGRAEQSGFEKTSFTGDSEIYIYYHQRDQLEARLASNGFVIEHFYTKDYPELDGSVTIDLIYIARKV